MESVALRQLLTWYPCLSELHADEAEAVLQTEVQWFQVPAGALLFHEGAPCQGFPMVLSGSVRVARGSPDGRSLELYRVTPGEICVVSTSCLFGQGSLSAHGHAAEATELALLSRAGFERCAALPEFRRYVFGVFADRLADLMALVEAVAFRRLDERLAQLLLQRGPLVIATHQALADELGTVREIVTRLLRRFERDGWVRLGRERIELQDRAALAALARP